MTRARSQLCAALVSALAGASVAGSVGCAGVEPTSIGTDAAAGVGGASGVVVDGGPGLGGSLGTGGASGSGLGGSPAAQDGGLDASSDAGAGVGGSSGAGGAPAVCTANATPVSPPDLMNLEAFPHAHARLRASAQGNRVTPVVYAWDVQWTGQQPTMTIPTTSLDAANALIEFPVDKEGPYRITLSVPGEPKCMYSARDAYAYRAVFVLRTSPGNGLPVQEDTIHLRANDPQDGAPIVMKQVEDTRIVPLHADGSPLLSFVRISQPGSDLRIDGETTHGSLTAPLSPFVSYDVLVVPDEDIAPAFFTGTSTVLRAPLVIDQGTPIRATVRDGANQPLAGARMILHRDALPSTVGTSDQSGQMTLWARAGTLSAFLVPPAASGLPPASVGADVGTAGIALDQAGGLDLQMTWDAVTTAPVAVTVRAPDGATLLAGAQVRATARAPSAPAPVGTLLATGGAGAVVPLRAVGATDVQVTTDAAGVAAFPALPVGDLLLTIVPPANPNGAGAVSDIAITSVPISVAAAGLTQTATLVNRVSLSGVLSDAAGALVTAIDTSITAPGRVVTATVDADGGYTLRVDPGRTYQLIVDPASNASVVRAMLGSVTAGTADTAIGTRVLPIGHPLTGSVTASAGGAISGALIQVFCPAWSSQCLDPSFALADTISDRTGRFQLRLAEPARN